MRPCILRVRPSAVLSLVTALPATVLAQVPMHGVVVSDIDHPIPGAQVQMEALSLVTSTQCTW